MTRTLLLAVLFAAGCSSPKPEVPIPPADQKVVAEGNNAFTLELYQKVAADVPGNVVLSPFSVRTAMAMLDAGATGESAASLRKLMHFELPDTRLHTALGGTAQNLAAREPYEFESANAVWPKAGLPLKPDFAAIMTNDYGAPVEALDYGNPEAARQRINAWTAEKTRKHIPEVLPAGSLSGNTTLVLTNAVYFKGTWKKKFDAESTRLGDFTLSSGETVKVPMMANDDMPGGAKVSEAGTWLRLPYKGDRLAMVIAMPPKGSKPGAMLAGLSAGQLADTIAGLREQGMAVVLPKFKFESSASLLNSLRQMGFVNADGDFDGIADGAGNVSSVEHAATVEVNEEGTVATAATAVAGTKSSYTPPLSVDRPFAFLIHDAKTGAVLFVGHVGDPR